MNRINDWSGTFRGGLAFDLAAQGNCMIPGIGLDAFGNLFPSSHRYAAVAVMVQLDGSGNDRAMIAER